MSENVKNYLNNLHGEEWTESFGKFIFEPSNDYLRVNLERTTKDSLKQNLLDGYGIELTDVEGIDCALQVVKDSERNIGKTIEHITGDYYIQSLASMMPPLVLDAGEEDRVLDLCAAPGSKTTMISEGMKHKGSLVANEIQHNRVGILSYNIERMKAFNAAIIKMPGEQISSFYPEFFDKVLVDAPCSGLGIIQKKGEVSNWWNADLVKKLSYMQQKLAISGLKCLKPGGTLLYSTCTLTTEENEEIINYLLDNYPVEVEQVTIPLKQKNGIVSFGEKNLSDEVSKSVRIDPIESGTEGFFLAKIIKRDSMEKEHKPKKRLEANKFKHNASIELAQKHITELFGIPAEVLNEYSYIERMLDIYLVSKNWDGGFYTQHHKLGLKIGTLDKYGNFIAHTNLVQIFDKYIMRNVYECSSMEEIKAYLDGGIIRNSEITQKRGQAAIKYRGRILGTGVFIDGGLKSRFPRSFRTQAITMANAD